MGVAIFDPKYIFLTDRAPASDTVVTPIEAFFYAIRRTPIGIGWIVNRVSPCFTDFLKVSV